MVRPRYPIYIPSRDRWQKPRALTARCLMKYDTPFYIVVEPQEREQYVNLVGSERVLVLPFSNLGQGSIPARNWIRQHAEEAGFARHWQLDDNIRVFRRMDQGMRIPCDPGMALRFCEDFTECYTNVGISGLNYQMFVVTGTVVPFYWNVHVYSCTLINHEMKATWRGRYNEDTDICLQALSQGWCTILINGFMADKMPSGVIAGGNYSTIYEKPFEGSSIDTAAEDGRLKMARELERRWPGIVKVERRYGRAQHVIDWRIFKREVDPQLDLLSGSEQTAQFDPPVLISKPREEWPVIDYMEMELSQVTEPRGARYRNLRDEQLGEKQSFARTDG